MSAVDTSHGTPFGPFAALHVHDEGAQPPRPWSPLRELVDDPARWDARVRATADALTARRPAGAPTMDAAMEVRVAASVAHLGLAARLLAPAVAAAALGTPAPSLSGDDVWWQDVLGGPVPVSSRLLPVEAAPLTLDGSVVAELTDLVARTGVGPRVAWGNVGSGANAAAAMVAAARPDLAPRARAAADAVLRDPRVDGGRLHSGPAFRRRSCCLIYRLAGSTDAACGDCVLTRP